MTDDLSCKELVELVTDYLEGALPEGERSRFEEHLAACEGCRAYLDQMRRTVALLGRVGEDDLSPRMRDDLLAAFRTWRASG